MMWDDELKCYKIAISYEHNARPLGSFVFEENIKEAVLRAFDDVMRFSIDKVPARMDITEDRSYG